MPPATDNHSERRCLDTWAVTGRDRLPAIRGRSIGRSTDSGDNSWAGVRGLSYLGTLIPYFNYPA